MRLRVIFGFAATKEVNWWQPLHNFPNIIQFNGRNYEWVTYDDDPSKQVDQVLQFSPLMSYDPNFNVACPIWEDLFPEGDDRCQCGAKYGLVDWDHMRFCPKWKPW